MPKVIEAEVIEKLPTKEQEETDASVKTYDNMYGSEDEEYTGDEINGF